MDAERWHLLVEESGGFSPDPDWLGEGTAPKSLNSQRRLWQLDPGDPAHRKFWTDDEVRSYWSAEFSLKMERVAQQRRIGADAANLCARCGG